MLISVGSKAPAFALSCQPGQVVDLATVIGHEKVVLLFFPLAFSPVCTTELCHFRDTFVKLNGMGCKVFGVSVDSPFVTAKFRELEKIPFPLLSDYNKDVSRSYGALHEDLSGLKGVSKRSVFVIDAKGIVQYAWISENPSVQVEFSAVEKIVQSC
ncbi:MAG: redoxin domain-containing protein [Phycisphaerales bacterium]|nr:redoxin domain-containing protein [Phycisphaerales bacterium]